MSSAKKVVDAGAAERKYIEDGRRNGNIALMLVGLAEIIIEPEKYQARVPWEDAAKRKHHVDMAWVRVLAGYRDRRNGEPLNPCVVFWDPKCEKYIMADGFHRYQEARSRHEMNLSCYVVTVDDPRRGALEYATMCNRELSKPRNKEDEKRAVFMLLDDEVWNKRSDSWIGDHVGVSKHTVGRWRLDYCEKADKPLPSRVATRQGQDQPYRMKNKQPTIREEKRREGDGRTRFASRIAGEKVYLGTDREEAIKKFQDCLQSQGAKILLGESPPQIGDSSNLRNLLRHRGILAEPLNLGPLVRPGMSGLFVAGLLVTPEPFDRPSNITAAVGRAVGLKLLLSHPGNVIIVCYPKDGPTAMIELYQEFWFADGSRIEFLTPDELVERIKGGAPDEHPD